VLKGVFLKIAEMEQSSHSNVNEHVNLYSLSLNNENKEWESVETGEI